MCEEALRRFPDEDELMVENRRRALGMSPRSASSVSFASSGLSSTSRTVRSVIRSRVVVPSAGSESYSKTAEEPEAAAELIGPFCAGCRSSSAPASATGSVASSVAARHDPRVALDFNAARRRRRQRRHEMVVVSLAVLVR